MKYPYIGKSKHENGKTILFLKQSTGFCLSDCSCGVYAFWKEEFFKNITREYLEGKCVKIESPEHSEFILLVCEANDIAIANRYADCNFAVFYEGAVFFCDIPPNDGFEQITIPLPPKPSAVSKVNRDIEREVWKVGDTVTWGKRASSAEVKALDDFSAWVKNIHGNYYTVEIRKLKKPKTEAEILRDELIELALTHMESTLYQAEENAAHLVHELMDKYIAKKPQ